MTFFWADARQARISLAFRQTFFISGFRLQAIYTAFQKYVPKGWVQRLQKKTYCISECFFDIRDKSKVVYVTFENSVIVAGMIRSAGMRGRFFDSDGPL